MQETIKTNSVTASCRKSEFEKILRSILRTLPFLASLAYEDFDMEELFDDGSASVEAATDERSAQWNREVTNKHTL